MKLTLSTLLCLFTVALATSLSVYGYSEDKPSRTGNEYVDMLQHKWIRDTIGPYYSGNTRSSHRPVNNYHDTINTFIDNIVLIDRDYYYKENGSLHPFKNYDNRDCGSNVFCHNGNNMIDLLNIVKKYENGDIFSYGDMYFRYLHMKMKMLEEKLMNV
jgi:hypothetical protein